MSDAKKTRISRRTLIEATAWSVPAIAVAAAAPAQATSHTPAPVIDLTDKGGACGNTGAQQKGCGGKWTLQVPLTLSNQTGSAIVFQITSMYTCNCSTAPTGPGTGVYSGITGIWSTNSHSLDDQSVCEPASYSACSGGLANGSIIIPDGTTDKPFWIESVGTGSASGFSTTINWRMLDATTCAVLSSGTAATTGTIASANCV